MRISSPVRLALSILALAACSTDTSSDASGSVTMIAQPDSASLRVIGEDNLLDEINDLAADSMEGRGPGTRGEDRTVAYLTGKLQALGLKPGNPDGTWIQNVQMVGRTSTPMLTITVNGTPLPVIYRDDYVANSPHDRAETKILDSDIVFVGYGVVAPEYGWDDYKGVDVRGKTILMLVNDPAVPAPGAPPGDTTSLDSTMFKGRAMTYYGRWTYKYEIGAEKGAAAVMIIHETGPAGYPFAVVQVGRTGEQLDVPAVAGDKRADVEGWFSLDKAKALLAASGESFDALKAAAKRKDFRPVTLNAKATFDVRTTTRQVQSRNVLAKLEGTGRKDEYVIYTGHWDHLGRDSTLRGDQIFNGALDNASGTAGVFEIARAFKAVSPAPDRTVLFLFVTAEERGLLGAKYYAANPLYPLEKTAANINLDGLNLNGRTTDMVVVGLGNSTLDDVLSAALAVDSRTVRPDAEPEKGFYYRSDHFEFAKRGVPALYARAGIDYIGKPAGYGLQKRAEYTQKDYHKVSDEVKPDWELSGAVADLNALFRVGYAVAQDDGWPQWKPGTEFKARRDSMMTKR